MSSHDYHLLHQHRLSPPLLLIALLSSLVGCGDANTTPVTVPTSSYDVASDDDPEIMLHINGLGSACFLTECLKPEDFLAMPVAATKTWQGHVSGYAVTPPALGLGSQVSVIGIAAPSGSTDSWCVEAVFGPDAVKQAPELEGFVVLIYLRDVGDGQESLDQIGVGGDYGASCLAQPEPFEWLTLNSGDYKTSIRTR